jgi:hypothetical protein
MRKITCKVEIVRGTEGDWKYIYDGHLRTSSVRQSIVNNQSRLPFLRP